MDYHVKPFSALCQRGQRLISRSHALVVSVLFIVGPLVHTNLVSSSKFQVAPESGTGSSKLRNSQRDVQVLDPSRPVERVLAGGEVHAYRIAVTSDQYLRVVVDQRGIDVVVTLLGPDDQKIFEVDSPNDVQGPESVSLVAKTSGSYQIEVRSLDKKAAAGHYEIRIKALRSYTPSDLTREAADRTAVEAGRLSAQEDKESQHQAILKYKEAIQLWRGIGEYEEEANALSIIGKIYTSLSEPQKALDFYNQALKIWRITKNYRWEADTLCKLSKLYNLLGERRTALEGYNQALPLWQAVSNPPKEAETLNNLGFVYEELGDKRKALTYYNQALPLWRAAHDLEGEAFTLNNIGLVYSTLGEKQEALKFYYQTLPLLRRLSNIADEARTLSNMGAVYFDLGEAQQALDAYNQALPLRRLAKDRPGEAYTLNKIGRAYDMLGAANVEYYRKALQIFQAESDRGGEAETLNYMGLAYWSLGKYREGLDAYNQALEQRRAMQDPAGEAATLNNLGEFYEALGEPQKALDYYKKALPLWRATGERLGEAITLDNLGFIYDSLGKRQKALDYHTHALRLSLSIGDRMREAKIRYGIARVARERGQPRQARAQIEQSLKIVEDLRANLTSQDLRASYRASVQRYYEFDIDVLMQLHKRQPSSGFDAAALQACERARARSLLELLAEARADIRQGVDPKLLERERDLQQLLNAKASARTGLLSGQQGQEEVAALNKEIATLTAEYQEVKAQIRQNSPRYAALTQPKPLDLAEIQQQVLDTDTLLLEYSLGEEHSYLWAVTKSSIKSYELPKREKIEAAILPVSALLTARSRQQASEGNKQQPSRLAQIEEKYLGPATPGDQRGVRRVEQADARYPEVAAALSKMLLGPAAQLLGKKRLLIVADGALQYLPFASLPDPASIQGGNRSWQPLVTEHEIVNLPSASTLAVLRQEIASRKPALKTVAILADPVFDQSDPRVHQNQGEQKPAESVPNLMQARLFKRVGEELTRNSGGDSLQRLTYTRLEAEQILSLIPEGEGKQMLDFRASRTAATSPDLGQYRYVHFATHGLLDSEQPELSAIVLSLVDEQGRSQDGFLRAHEVYNLNLAAELVVLSACETGLGKEIKGEGLVGLTRGFMYAGAPRVVVSLWSVSDEATAELMVRFYRGMLKEGLRPAAALRAAQLSLWREKRWEAPYYWAAFVLQGEWQ